IDMTADGRFEVAWGADPYTGYVVARRVDSTGAALGADFQVNTYTIDERVSPHVGVSANGFVIVWSAFTPDGEKGGIFGQRYGTIGGLDADGNGTISALTDGLLVLRFLFGFTGATLSSGATGMGCTRCDGASIAGYLTGLGSTLDVDGNGSKT